MAPKEKVSLSLDRDLISEVRRRVGRRELSSFLNDALERRLQTDAVNRYLGEAEQRAGRVPKRVSAAVDQTYTRRFERTRAAKLRRRVAEGLQLDRMAPAERAEIEAAIMRAGGLDLLGLQERATRARVSLQSIVGSHPIVSVEGVAVKIVDVDPALEDHATAS
jgi:hypothetical protein